MPLSRKRRIEREAQAPSEATLLLQNLSRVRGTTRAALNNILQIIQQHPRVDFANATERLHVAERALLERCRHEFKFEDDISWEIADPCLLLASFYEESAFLRDVFAKAFARHPCTEGTPWHIIVGFDEYTPGSMHKPVNHKKAMALSFSFFELGAEALKSSACWFTPVVLRHDTICEIEGGWCRCLSRFLEHFLVGPRGITTAGLPLENPDGSYHVLFARLRILLSDGDGIRAGFGWKGARGLKCCIRHTNVWALNSDVAHRGEDQVEITCSNPASFRTATKDDLEEITDVLAEASRSHNAGRMTQQRYTNITQALGFNDVSGGVLQNARLREAFDVAEVITYGWMHTYLQDGILSKECWEIVEMCRQSGFGAPELQAFVRSFTFPSWYRDKGRMLHDAFSAHRFAANVEAAKLKSSASELLSLYSLLRHFRDVELADPAADLEPALASFDACCACVDVILQAKHGLLPMRDAARLLRERQQRHMELHAVAHGVNLIAPKFHWQFDIAEQIHRDADFNYLVDEFIIERMHLRIKPTAEAHDSTGFEAGVLAGVIATQRRDLENAQLGDTLLGKTWRMPGAPGTILSKAMRVNGVSVEVGDVIAEGRGAGFGVVTACAFEGVLLFVGDALEVQGKISTHGWRCRRLPQRRAWHARAVVPASAWQRNEELFDVLEA